MPSYSLELELFSMLNASTTGFEIWSEGLLLGGYSSTVSSAGSSISITVNYGGALPSSLEFRFNDSAPGSVDQIEVRSVVINNRYVNMGNYLSTNILNDGGTSVVTINADNSFLFDDTPPPGSTFTTGATQSFTTGNDTYANIAETAPQVFDMLDGRDVAYLGSGDDTVSGGAGNDIIYGRDGNDLIYGDTGDDLIQGGNGDDTLYGGDGNDRLHGNEGNDEIHGGGGNDRLHGHDGNDVITGGTGADVISGGEGDDILFGDDGDDQIVGGNGNDTIDGGDGNDVLYGNAGNDTINGGADNDFLIGGLGNDILHGDDGDDILFGQQGLDNLYGGNGRDTLYGGADNDFLDGGAGEDEIFGGDGIDTISGGLGHDIIHGGDGNDIINGGDGDDVIFADGGANSTGWIYKYYDLSTSPTTLAAAGFTLNSQIDNSLDATRQGITEIFDPAFFDTGDNYAIKYETYLTITIAGNYTFRTRSDDGSMLFLDGVQIVDNDGLHAARTVTSGAQALAAGVYKLDATFFERTGGNVMEIDMSGPDTGSVFVSLEDYAGVNPANGAGSVISGDDIIDGGDGNDTIYGDLGDDIISGGLGNDSLYGGDGNDIINGGAGNDTIYATTIADASIDLVSDILAANPSVVYNASTGNFYQYVATTGTWTTQQAAAAATNLNGVAGYLTVVSSQEENDYLTTISGGQRLWIGGNDATSEGEWFWTEGPEAGTQFWTGGAAGSPVGGLYSNWVSGDPSNGSAAWDYIEHRADGTWWANANTANFGYVVEWEGAAVLGTTGTNILSGGDGSDTLYGNDGTQDIFVFLSGETGADTINNFIAADGDAIDISDLLTGYTAGVSDINDFVRFANSGANTLIQVDGNGATGGASFTTIATISSVNNLDADALLYNQSIIA